ncbi:MAG: protein-tyrosine phosphatase-like protein [Benniella sp.]|nr:MAG: protein-tyrosine phosphatase-like protein [Benniella sp.]
MSALSQSHHSPTAAAVPAELKIQEIQCETVSSLLAQVLSTLDGSDNGDRNAIMLLDMRPSVLYATSTIKTAVNLCISSILLKRQTYSLQSVTGQLTTEQDIEIFSRWRQFSNIVFFDASGSAPVVGSPTFFMAQKFRREGCTATLAYLHGGFNKFSTQFSDQCRADEAPGSGGSPQILTMSGSGLSSSAPSSATGTAAPGIGGPLPPASTSSNPRQRLHLGALPSLMTQPPVGPLGCQTPMIENPNINPLFENVRQAMGLSTNITEEIPVRLPMGFTVQTMQDHLPRWLQCAIAEGSGKTRLAEFFQKVEISENKRLALLMLPQNMRSGRTSNFSIGAGIEQGLKNRYHNIWPYDHTRVKIAEVEEGHDDYINASFLTPLLSKKTYIATQGPLPSTFQDFWKSTWEQNSRVVVMLTREQEMGRIKCHEYWPSPKQPVMEVGSMRVVFINEFLPDPTIGTILVRQLKLSLKNHPESEERNITQIQYTGWPDFGVPETPLEVLRVVQLANEYNVPLATAGPMVVHCSAGCGRTGAFCGSSTSPTSTTGPFSGDDILSDIVYSSVSMFREQRISMVQTLRQYVFCYEAIYWHLAREYAKERPALGLVVIPPPSMAVHTPLLPIPPNTGNPAMSMGNAPNTTTNEEFSFFG